MTRSGGSAELIIRVCPCLSTLVLAGLLLLIPAILEAQLTGGLTIGNGYSSNVFGISAATAAAMQNVGISAAWFSEDERLAVGYSGDMLIAPSLPDRRFSVHTLSASSMFLLDSDGKTRLSAFASAILRAGRETYAAYDYSQAMASVSLRRELQPSFRLRAGYRARYRHYPDLAYLSHLEHYASVGGNSSFESRTGIDIDAAIGVKNYMSAYREDASPSSLLSSYSSFSVEGNGPGGGGNGGGGANNGGKRYGPGGAAGHLSAGGAPLLISRESIAAQLVLSGAVSQSVFEGTGVSLRYRQRINLKERGTALIGTWISSAADDDLVDDPYAYESNEVLLQLTQMLPMEMTMRTGTSIQARRYFYGSSLDPEITSDARKDFRSTVAITVERTFDTGWRLLNDVAVALEYQFIRNQSNSDIYDYSAHYVGLEFDVGISF